MWRWGFVVWAVYSVCGPPSRCVAASLCCVTVRGSRSCFASPLGVQVAFLELALRNCCLYASLCILMLLYAWVVYFISVFMQVL